MRFYFPICWEIVQVVLWSFSIVGVIEFVPSVVARVADSVEVDSNFIVESRFVRAVV